MLLFVKLLIWTSSIAELILGREPDMAARNVEVGVIPAALAALVLAIIANLV